MSPHPSLASLLRDHEDARAVARGARALRHPELDPALGSGPDASAAAAHARRWFRDAFEPVLEIEARELVARTASGGGPLASLGDRVVAQHAELRRLVTALEGEPSAGALGAFADALESHVDFAGEIWLPAVTEALGAESLGRLGAALRAGRTTSVLGFREGEDGAWIADLACGHAQHVRPTTLERRPWVATEAGRAAKIGARWTCLPCRMPAPPRHFVEYKRTSELDAGSVPAGLLRSHRLKPGVWGEIVVTAGRLLYVLEDEGDWGVVLKPELRGGVAPERPHHVALEADARFFVRFLAPP